MLTPSKIINTFSNIISSAERDRKQFVDYMLGRCKVFKSAYKCKKRKTIYKNRNNCCNLDI